MKGKNKEGQRRAMFARMNNPNKSQNTPTLFFKNKNKRLARIIRIDSPSHFRQSIRTLKKGGLTQTERQALILAQNRARAQLSRKNLSKRERVQMRIISKEKVPETPTKSRSLKQTDPFKAAQRKKELSKTKDSDGDGVVDAKDCEPNNPKKQGYLHDLHIRILRKKEEKIEKKREKELKKLEDLKDTLEEKRKVAQAKTDIKSARLNQKQAVIDELNREKNKIKELKEQNRQAKKAIFDATPAGKATKASKKAISATKKFFQSPKTKKFFKKLGKQLS